MIYLRVAENFASYCTLQVTDIPAKRKSLCAEKIIIYGG
jgi:hypothetical protein